MAFGGALRFIFLRETWKIGLTTKFLQIGLIFTRGMQILKYFIVPFKIFPVTL